MPHEHFQPEYDVDDTMRSLDAAFDRSMDALGQAPMGGVPASEARTPFADEAGITPTLDLVTRMKDAEVPKSWHENLDTVSPEAAEPATDVEQRAADIFELADTKYNHPALSGEAGGQTGNDEELARAASQAGGIVLGGMLPQSLEGLKQDVDDEMTATMNGERGALNDRPDLRAEMHVMAKQAEIKKRYILDDDPDEY